MSGLIFDIDTFSFLLEKEKSVHTADKVEELLESYVEEERERKSHLLNVCHKIMCARTMGEVADVPLEDLVGCIEVVEDFYNLYCDSYGGEELRRFGGRVEEAKTCRHRRVL